MNAVEIEEAVSALAAAPFDPAEFPYQFLAAFGNIDTTIKRLRAGSTNASDLPVACSGATTSTSPWHPPAR